MKRGRGWKMTGRGIKREKRVDSFGKAIRSHDGWYGSSPAFSSIEIAVPSTNVFDWSAIRFVSLPSFLHCLFLFLSFFSHRRIAKIPLTYNFVSRSPLCRFSRRILYKGSSRQFAKLLSFNAKLINGNFVKLWNYGVEKGAVYDLRMRLLFLIWNYFGAPIL